MTTEQTSKRSNIVLDISDTESDVSESKEKEEEKQEESKDKNENQLLSRLHVLLNNKDIPDWKKVNEIKEMIRSEPSSSLVVQCVHDLLHPSFSNKKIVDTLRTLVNLSCA